MSPSAKVTMVAWDVPSGGLGNTARWVSMKPALLPTTSGGSGQVCLPIVPVYLEPGDKVFLPHGL